MRLLPPDGVDLVPAGRREVTMLDLHDFRQGYHDRLGTQRHEILGRL